MAHVIFDTLNYVKKAKEAGLPDMQAEFQAEVLAEIVNDQLVTQQHLTQELKHFEYRILFKVGIMLAVSIGILATIIKL